MHLERRGGYRWGMREREREKEGRERSIAERKGAKLCAGYFLPAEIRVLSVA